VEQKFQRTRLVSPLDGIILSGDLSRSLGAPVERGQILFEVAPLDQYRLVLNIDAREIVDVRTGQRGKLVLSSLPGEEIPFVIDQVSPVFQEEEGKISYRTEARIQGSSAVLRPGMDGVGKISVGRRSYGWIFFHSMIDWLRMKMWSWQP
jgi:multidrug efflux pump subunit AcrA (membrane-fusion protein)